MQRTAMMPCYKNLPAQWTPFKVRSLLRLSNCCFVMVLRIIFRRSSVQSFSKLLLLDCAVSRKMWFSSLFLAWKSKQCVRSAIWSIESQSSNETLKLSFLKDFLSTKGLTSWCANTQGYVDWVFVENMCAHRQMHAYLYSVDFKTGKFKRCLVI